MTFDIEEFFVGEVYQNLAHVAKPDGLNCLLLPIWKTRLKLNGICFQNTHGNGDDNVFSIYAGAVDAHYFASSFVFNDCFHLLTEVNLNVFLFGYGFDEPLVPT